MRKIKTISAVTFCLYIIAVAYLCFARPDDIPQAPMYLFGIPTDKAAHFLMFLPFPILAYMTFFGQGMGLWRKTALLVTVMVFGAGVAIGTERIQTALGYRTGDVNDFLADSIGLIAGGIIILCSILLKHFRKRQ